MSTEIKYKNIGSEFITERQASQLDYFSKLFYIDDELKKEEIYFHNKLNGGVYFLNTNENPIEILNELGIHLKWTFAMNKQQINGYNYIEYHSYDENLQLKPKYLKRVEDASGNLIAFIEFDRLTNQHGGGGKIFHFGGVQVPDDDEGVFFEEDAKLMFVFDSNGNIEKISMNNEYVNNSGYWTTLNDFINDASFFVDDMMPSTILNYFSNVEPIIPNF